MTLKVLLASLSILIYYWSYFLYSEFRVDGNPELLKSRLKGLVTCTLIFGVFLWSYLFLADDLKTLFGHGNREVIEIPLDTTDTLELKINNEHYKLIKL